MLPTQSDSMVYLEQIYPRRALLSVIEAGEALGYREQTVRNKLHHNSFPVPTYVVGAGRRVVKKVELAAYIDSIGGHGKKAVGRPRGSTKAARIAAAGAGKGAE